jgi:AraC-like DNA-binding protein
MPRPKTDRSRSGLRSKRLKNGSLDLTANGLARRTGVQPTSPLGVMLRSEAGSQVTERFRASSSSGTTVTTRQSPVHENNHEAPPEALDAQRFLNGLRASASFMPWFPANWDGASSVASQSGPDSRWPGQVIRHCQSSARRRALSYGAGGADPLASGASRYSWFLIDEESDQRCQTIVPPGPVDVLEETATRGGEGGDGGMGLQGSRNARWAKDSGVLAEHVEIDAPFLRTTSWRVSPLYKPWVGNVAVNQSTSESDRFRFFRLPESQVFLALVVAPDGAQLLIGGANLRVQAVPPFSGREVIGPIGIRAGGAQLLLGMPSSEVANQIIDADAIWGSWAREVVERVALEQTTELRISRLLDLLQIRIKSSPDTITEQIVALAASRRGAAPVRELAGASGYSERQLRRKFLDHVGVAPKDFGRINRVNAALRGLAAAPSSWSSYATAHGYYDQAHLIAEFRELVGQTPTRFLESLVDPRLLGHHVAIQAVE